MCAISLVLSFFFISSSFAFDWQGHRGARGLYPENTIEGMKEAMKFPVTTLELDVVISKDNKVVVSHEPWMNPLICEKGKEKNLYQMDYEEIVKVDCGSKSHPRFPDQKRANVGKPLLSRLIRDTKEFGRNYNVEIKSTPEYEKLGYQPNYKVMTDLVVKELKELLPVSRFVIQSFDWRVLKYIKENYPEVSLSALSEEGMSPEEVVKALGFAPAIWSPYFKELTPDHVEKFHALGIKVIPWTANTVEEMNALLAMKVDGIITDYPNLITSTGKACPPKRNLYDGKCIKIPTHAVATDKNPGWVCRPAYQQWRKGCRKINLPKHAHFLEDGKTWVCDEGYERYRGSCKKK